MKTVSPIDGSVYVERELASPQQIEAALARAAAAQKAWQAVPVVERAAICTSMAGWCVNRAELLGEELTRQMGRPIAHTPFEIQRGFQERVAYMASVAPATLADIAIAPKENFQRFIRREPLGVVFVVAPWNYPVAHLGERRRAGAPRRQQRHPQDGAADAARRRALRRSVQGGAACPKACSSSCTSITSRWRA